METTNENDVALPWPELPSVTQVQAGTTMPFSVGLSQTDHRPIIVIDGEEIVDEAGSSVEAVDAEIVEETVGDHVVKVRKRKKRANYNAGEMRLPGRLATCKTIPAIVGRMLQSVKLKILGGFLPATRHMDDKESANQILCNVAGLASPSRILKAADHEHDDFSLAQLKAMIIEILLQEESHGLPEAELAGKIVEFENGLIARAKSISLEKLKASDPDRWHRLETYKIVMATAYDDGKITKEESRLLTALRNPLKLSMEDHWMVAVILGKFPKDQCVVHNANDVNEARKELQKKGLVWSFKDEDERTIDTIPLEIASVLRQQVTAMELQRANYRRLLNNDAINLSHLRLVLQRFDLDSKGAKEVIIDRVLANNIMPSMVLDELDKDRLASMCGSFGLRVSGSKADLKVNLIAFYDDLTFEDPPAYIDPSEELYNNYELLACRSYAELRAKKLITQDIDTERLFEKATVFLFQNLLKLTCGQGARGLQVDGRIFLDDDQKETILWDCKSVLDSVNLQDHLEVQFDGYLRKEKEQGRFPIGLMVIGPAFAQESVKLAISYKAKRNWNITLITASALKHIAERWQARQEDTPFNVRLFGTELIDIDRADYYLNFTSE